MQFPECITNLTGKTIWLRENLRAVRMFRVVKAKLADKLSSPLHEQPDSKQFWKLLARCCGLRGLPATFISRSLFSGLFCLWPYRAVRVSRPEQAQQMWGWKILCWKGNSSADTDVPSMASCKSIFWKEERFFKKQNTHTKKQPTEICQFFF